MSTSRLIPSRRCCSFLLRVHAFADATSDFHALLDDAWEFAARTSFPTFASSLGDRRLQSTSWTDRELWMRSTPAKLQYAGVPIERLYAIPTERTVVVRHRRAQLRTVFRRELQNERRQRTNSVAHLIAVQPSRRRADTWIKLGPQHSALSDRSSDYEDWLAAHGAKIDASDRADDRSCGSKAARKGSSSRHAVLMERMPEQISNAARRGRRWTARFTKNLRGDAGVIQRRRTRRTAARPRPIETIESDRRARVPRTGSRYFEQDLST